MNEVPKPHDANIETRLTHSSTITRRDLLTKASIAAVVGTAIGVEAVKEIQVPKEGIETDIGAFFPLYEMHSEGIKIEEIPPQLDGFFNEGYITDVNLNDASERSDVIYRISPSELLTTDWKNPSHSLQVVKKLAEENVKIIFGDVDVGSFEEIYSSVRDRLSLATLVSANGVLYDKVRKIIEKRDPEEPPYSSRRKFLKYITFGAATTIALPAISSVGINSFSEPNEGRNRIFVRLNGVVLNGAPEQHVTFLRSLIMADKLLTVAEFMKEQGKENPRIAFRTGAKHAGMEDFLKAGHEFCRWLVTQYPKDFLTAIVNKNGGIDNFTSARMLTVPPTVMIGSELWEGMLKGANIADERIIDMPLQNALQKKLTG